MCNSKSILPWKRTLNIFALILAGSLAVKIAPGQTLSTLKSSFGEKDINGTEVALTKHLGQSQDVDLVKGKLMEDRVTVEKAGRTVLPDLKNAGYSDKEAASGLAWSWYELRAGQHAVPLTTKLSMATIQTKAAKLGRLVIKSKPSDAAISVDTFEWPSHTDAQGFADVGDRAITVSARGLEPVTKTCSVVRDRTMTFVATLQKKGSKAECK